MELIRINIYERLRDFNVPVEILDEIFSFEEDLNKLIVAWQALKKDGFSDDDTAMKYPKYFLKNWNYQTMNKKGCSCSPFYFKL